MYNSYQRNAPAALSKTTIEPPSAARPLPAQREVPEHLTPAARQLRSIHPTTASRMHDLKAGHSKQVKSIAWSCNGQTLATAGEDRNVRLWEYKRPGEAPGPSYRTPSDPFSQSNPDPLLPSASSSNKDQANLPSSSSATTATTTTADSPIVLLAFAPRDPDILAVASAGLAGGENQLMRVRYPGDAEEEVEWEAERTRLLGVEDAGARGAAGDGSRRGEERKIRMDGPKVTIWNIRKRQILAIVPLPPSTPVALTFHPSSLQLAIVFMQSGLGGQDTAWFLHRPKSAGDPASELLLEDPAGGRAEQIKREREKVWLREIAGRDEVAPAAPASAAAINPSSVNGESPRATDDRWHLRTGLRLGERGYKIETGERVPEFNGATFSPCGTKFYAGNHDGALYAWGYPIVSPEVIEPVEQVGLDDADEGIQKVQGDGDRMRVDVDEQVTDETPDNGETKEGKAHGEDEGDGEDEDEDEDGSNGRRRRKVDSGVQEDEPTEEEAVQSIPVNVAVGGGDLPSEEVAVSTEELVTEEKDVEMKGPEAEESTSETAAVDGEAVEEAKVESQEDTSKAASPVMGSDADVEMKDVDDGSAKTLGDPEQEIASSIVAATAEMAPDQVSPALKSKAAALPSGPTTSMASTKPATTPKKAPADVAKQLQFLFRQSMHVGCLNCIDIDPKRRYIATGGSEGLVNLSDHRTWISLKTFDSYTEEVKHLKFSWDGEYLAAAGQDRCIDIMATATGTTVHRIQTRTNVQCLAWSPARHVLCFSLEAHASGAAGQMGDWFYVTL